MRVKQMKRRSDPLFRWKPSYDKLARQFIKEHFKTTTGITLLFPLMSRKLKWKDKKRIPLDVRTVTKNAVAYHGLERHAHQCHVAGQYDHAYRHWLIAACWRRENNAANRFYDAGHRRAARFALQHALYNKALSDWQARRLPTLPLPEDFGLVGSDVDLMDQRAEEEIFRAANI
jgi:hypothetical protein